MDEYRLTQKALRDLDTIRRRLQREASVVVADKVELALFEAFDELVLLKPLGHRREDLDDPSLLIHNVYSYAVIFRREPRVVILRIVHGARDLPRLLRKG